MANKIEEKKEIFNQKRQEYKDMKDKKSNYSKRIEDSKAILYTSSAHLLIFLNSCSLILYPLTSFINPPYIRKHISSKDSK